MNAGATILETSLEIIRGNLLAESMQNHIWRFVKERVLTDESFPFIIEDGDPISIIHSVGARRIGEKYRIYVFVSLYGNRVWDESLFEVIIPNPEYAPMQKP